MISIITPCLNSEKTILKTLISVYNQTHKDIEYIIIDGNSTDTTMDIVRSFFSDNALRFSSHTIISEPDDGLYDAMNKGIKRAIGELIGIINSDDWYEVNACSDAWLSHQKHPNHIINGLLRIHTNNGTYIKGYSAECLEQRQMIQHPTCFIPKDIYKQHGTFNTCYKFSADYDFFCRVYNLKVKFILLEVILANFKIGGASSNPKTEIESRSIAVKYGYLAPPQKSRTRIFNKLRKIFNAF